MSHVTTYLLIHVHSSVTFIFGLILGLTGLIGIIAGSGGFEDTLIGFVRIVVIGVAILVAFGACTGFDYDVPQLFALGLYGVAIAAVALIYLWQRSRAHRAPAPAAV